MGDEEKAEKATDEVVVNAMTQHVEGCAKLRGGECDCMTVVLPASMDTQEDTDIPLSLTGDGPVAPGITSSVVGQRHRPDPRPMDVMQGVPPGVFLDHAAPAVLPEDQAGVDDENAVVMMAFAMAGERIHAVIPIMKRHTGASHNVICKKIKENFDFLEPAGHTSPVTWVALVPVTHASRFDV